MSKWDAVKRSLRYNYLKIMRLKASTHAVALGLAVGVFVGFLPVIPFQTVIALTLAFLVRGSKIPAALGTWVSNPVNMIPFYAMLFYVGRFLLPGVETPELNFHHLELESMIHQGWGLVVVMFVGGLVLGIPAAFVTYVVTFRAVNSYRQKRMIRLIRKHQANRVNAGNNNAAGTAPDATAQRREGPEDLAGCSETEKQKRFCTSTDRQSQTREGRL